MKRGPQEITRPVAGEDPPRAVAAVRRRGEPDDEDPRLGIAEAGQRTTPVRLVREARDLLASDSFAPLNEARTAAAGDDLGAERFETVSRVDPYGRVDRRTGLGARSRPRQVSFRWAAASARP